MTDTESESEADVTFVAVEQSGQGFPIIANTREECAKEATIKYDLNYSCQYAKNWNNVHSDFEESERFLSDDLSWVPYNNPTDVVMYRVVDNG